MTARPSRHALRQVGPTDAIVPWWDAVATGRLPADAILSCGPATLGPIASTPGLVDGYLIGVHPAVLTAGPRMFNHLSRDLASELVHADVFDAGSVVLQYRAIEEPWSPC